MTARLEFRDVSKWYGPVRALDGVNLRLEQGITGLVGPNGSGKTTLLRLAAGLTRPSSGTVLIGGQPAQAARTRSQLGYVPETDRFPEDWTGGDFLSVLARFHGEIRRQQVERCLHRVGLAHVAGRPIGSYSKGMKQRLKLAQALLHQPNVLLCDEPFNGVDPAGRAEFARLLAELAQAGMVILVSSHQLEELEQLADQFVVLARGRVLAQGTLDQTRQQLENYPSLICVETSQPRQLAGWLLQWPMVLGVELAGPQAIQMRVRQPHEFFTAFQRFVVEQHWDVYRLEMLDASAEAVLQYLLAQRQPVPW
ncbi:MAG: ABC transporter ATP-binding protein [Gemmatales bacterium]|nr:ABC transporter ATP-binding protein [Gemmatales bacterium]MDW7993811.1 ABC transporter ATP-binding protein [Gemmatales bacterium]